MAEKLTHIRIVGAGLIGTSIGLALKAAGLKVSIRDSDRRAEGLARDLLDDREGENTSVEQLCIIATPPEAIAHVVAEELSRNPGLRVMDVSSIKTKPLLDISKTSLDAALFAPTHPMAGREVSGPESARGDLFIGRPWVLTSDGVDPSLLAHVKEVIALCGGALMIRSAADHDRAVAQVSHLPQILSSLLAGSLNRAHQEDLELAGSGLRDTTRLADSNPELWGQILSGNAEALRPLLISLQNDLSAFPESMADSLVNISS
jgi:prephenate dehydrogenase